MRAVVLMAVSAHVSAVVFNHAHIQSSNVPALLSKRSRLPCDCYDDCDVVVEPKPFNSLQVTLDYPEVQPTRPLAWLHIPKAGSTFLNALYQHPGICPGSYEDTVLPQESSNMSDPCFLPVPDFFDRYPEWTFCPGSTYEEFSLEEAGRNHYSVHMKYDLLKGSIMAMFRQPEQRLISAYNYNHHGWMSLSPPANLSEFAEEMQGCQTKMLSRDGHEGSGPCLVMNPYPPTEEETDLAVSRVREGLSFIGLTEQWDLSICLFHAMFGAKCTDAEFANMRPGDDGGDGLYDTTELYGFEDKADRIVYAEAEKIFNENLKKYGVNSSTCPSMCQ